MGTRHLICIVAGGSYKLAQYGQWDGYPSGQGQTILAFLGLPGNAERLRAGLERVIEPTVAEVEAFYAKLGAKKSPDGASYWLTQAQSDKLAKLHPGLSRDASAKILEVISASTDKVWTRNSIAFAGDSLFCEWAYVIDFDKGTFEVYKGFNQKRLASGERFKEYEDPSSEYRPVKHLISYPLDTLPSLEAFLAIERDEDEESEPEEETPNQSSTNPNWGAFA